MRVTLHRVACVLLAAVTAGCASTYEPVDNSYIGSQKSATIVLSPSEKPIYRQIDDDGRRVAEIEFSAFQEGMLASGQLAASYGILFWSSSAVATSSAVVIPGLGLGIAAISGGMGTVVDSYRFERAEASVAEHSELLQELEIDELAKTVVETSVSEFSHLEVAAVTDVDALFPAASQASAENNYQSLVRGLKQSLGTESDAAQDGFEAVLSQIDSDFVVTLTYFPQFSPNFEVLEVHALVSVYDRNAEAQADPIYSNAVFYQSALHGGQYLPDTREVVDEFIEQYRQKVAWRESRGGHDKLSGHQKLQIDHQLRQKRYVLERNYTRVDKHDPDGQLWLQDGGQAMFAALEEGLREIVRLVVYDLNADQDESVLADRTLPGTVLEMRFIDVLSNDKRHVYRSERGALHSVDGRSRFVLYEPVN